MKKALFSCLLFLFPLVVYAKPTSSPCGEYAVSGFDPFACQEYFGIARICQTGPVYQVTWTFVDPEEGRETTSIGTGFVAENIFSVNFEDFNPAPTFGGGFYRICEDELIGHWTYLGQTLVGKEKWVKIWNAQ